MIKDRFNIILNAAAVKILYISLPKPASDDFPITKPCLQNSCGDSPRTLAAPGKLIEYVNIYLSRLLLSTHFILFSNYREK